MPALPPAQRDASLVLSLVTMQSPMLVAAIMRCKGAGWTLHLSPAASRGLLSATTGGRAAAAAAQASGAAGEAAAATPKRRGRPPKNKAPYAVDVAGGPGGSLPVLLVESPAKARKIQEFLGPGVRVLASYGHIRDLPARPGSVDPSDGFAMRWAVLPAAAERLPALAEAVRGAERLWLATDPDREGEAISWHLEQELRGRGALGEATPCHRITFTEVTKRAVELALAQPRQISEPLVHAYMARRALDYLFGFHLSPVLWRKLPAARSAGRVQSVALRLLCEREAAIAAFQPQQYFTVDASLRLPGGAQLQARLAEVDGVPPPQPGYPEQEAAEAVAARVAAAAFAVRALTRREQQRQPPPPFITSTLQQEANRRLGFSTSRTMQLAQQLYEAGHITYMRTDGVALAPAAVDALRAAAAAEHGAHSVPPEPRAFKAQGKNAQEAHEAIRPTEPGVTAEQLAAQGVEGPAAKLYGLIRGRALACQMAAARVASVAAELASPDGALVLRATASAIASPGFLAAYFDPAALASATDDGDSPQDGTEGTAVAKEGEEEDEAEAVVSASKRAQQEAARAAAAAALEALQRGDAADVRGVQAAAHETRPPPRFSEGSLVRRMEELGIGRPSTYAPTLAVLAARGYARREGRALHAEPLGRVLSAFLETYFPQYVDYGFTSGMEDLLDEVSGGGGSWEQLLADFWTPFSGRVDEVAGVPVSEVIDRLNEVAGDSLIGSRRLCPNCSSPLSLKLPSRKQASPFVGCTAYPACSYSRPIEDGPGQVAAEGLEAGSRRGGAAPKDISIAEAAAAAAGVKGYARLLGEDPATGMLIFLRVGLYGTYVQRGVSPEQDGNDFRRQALPKKLTRAVDLDTALALLQLPRDLGANPATGDSVLVSMGKFGPFIRCGVLTRSVPSNYDAMSLTMADALQILANKSTFSSSKAARRSAAASAGARTSPAPKKGKARNAAEDAGMPALDATAPAAAAAANEEHPVEGAGWEGLQSSPDTDDSQALWLDQARAEARLALDAAAELEVGQLHAVLGAHKDGVADRAAVNGYILFFQSMMARAQVSGNRWEEAQPVAREIARRWRDMPAEERRAYEEQATAERMENEARAQGLLGQHERLASLPAGERALVEAELARQQLHSVSSFGKQLRQQLTLPRPRTAYNLFTHMARHCQILPRDNRGGDPLTRIAELWRNTSQQERVPYKLQAEEEMRLYRTAKTALTRRQQEATATAVQAGMDPVSAARAGILAGRTIVESYAASRQERLDQATEALLSQFEEAAARMR